MSWLSFVISVARVVEQLPSRQSIAGLTAEPHTLHFAVFLKKYYKNRCCDRPTNILRQQLLLKTQAIENVNSDLKKNFMAAYLDSPAVFYLMFVEPL